MPRDVPVLRGRLASVAPAPALAPAGDGREGRLGKKACARAVGEYETLVGDVQDLRAFALAVDLRSLTQAARVLGESKATVSRRLTRLEEALGVQLLTRTPRTVEATDDGAAYRARVGEILELLGDANAAVIGAQAAPSGQLRLTAPPGFDAVLAPLLVKFAARYPQVVVSTLITARFVDLNAEHLDVALRATSKLADSALVAHRLSEVDHILVAAPSYLRESPAPRRVEDLASHRLVLAGELRGATSVTLRKAGPRASSLGESTTVVVPSAMAASDVSFARELTLAGAGVSVLPRPSVQRDVSEKRLVHLLPAYVSGGSSLFLLHRGGRFLSPKVRAFRDFAVEELRAASRPVARAVR